MRNWRENVELAEVLLQAIRHYSLTFEEGEIPDNPVSRHGPVNTLFYARTAVLSEDAAGILTSYGQAAENIFGYEPDEAIGMESARLVPEELMIGRAVLFDEIIEKEMAKTVSGVVRVQKSGKQITLSADVFPHRVGNNEVSIAAIVRKE
jgi:PAS domain S-box-containing protein